jgi:glutamine amidotransferase
MSTVIIQYNAGNIQSVLYALERLGVAALVTDDPIKIKTADRVIFPGVGEASTAMQYLKERQLDILIQNLKQPVLGICLGMQLMCTYSEENNTNCLGIFNEQVKQFRPENNSIKVPQMGWNTITHLQTPLFKGVEENSYAYFGYSQCFKKFPDRIKHGEYENYWEWYYDPNLPLNCNLFTTSRDHLNGSSIPLISIKIPKLVMLFLYASSFLACPLYE